MYTHGIYTQTTDTDFSIPASNEIAQVVIGTAPVHTTSNPEETVNKPILCRTMADCRSKLGYSTDFAKYTLCQSMYCSFTLFRVAPVVFINVLDPAKHKTEVEEKEYQINDNSIEINDDVIVSSLVIKRDSTPIPKEEYETDWFNNVLTINFVNEQTGVVSVAYDKVDPSKVKASDIVGEWDTETDTRTGLEVLKNIFPSIGVVPFILTAPGWTTDDIIGTIMAEKTIEINGCYKAMAIMDIDTTTAKTREAAIEAKRKRTLNENCIAAFPMIKKNDMIIAYSALLSALIMHQATQTEGITCKSPSNQKISIDNVVRADGEEVFYDQEDGNELNAEGIVTVIARNGWYTWGNNTAAYPDTVDPVKRWIMTRLSFHWIENDFINSYFSVVDSPLNKKMVENCVTDENIKLSAWSAMGYIAGGKIYYNAGDNPDSEILQGKFTFRTSLAGNIPGETINNIFSFDTETLYASILGGETNE